MEKTPEGFSNNTNHDWDTPPKFCPFCGGSNLVVEIVAWEASSMEDEDNHACVYEHQCLACEGRSFWS